MNLKKLSKINDAEATLYGATMQQYMDARTYDTVGIGIDEYSKYYGFTAKALAEIATDRWADAQMSTRVPEEVLQWEKDHNMDQRAKEFAESVGAIDYEVCGGLVVYTNSKEKTDYKILESGSGEVSDSKIQDSDWESQLWKAINSGKRDFTITIDPNEMEADQLEDYIYESFEDTGDCVSVSVSIEGNQASIRIEECDEDYEDI